MQETSNWYYPPIPPSPAYAFSRGPNGEPTLPPPRAALHRSPAGRRGATPEATTPDHNRRNGISEDRRRDVGSSLRSIPHPFRGAWSPSGRLRPVDPWNGGRDPGEPTGAASGPNATFSGRRRAGPRRPESRGPLRRIPNRRGSRTRLGCRRKVELVSVGVPDGRVPAPRRLLRCVGKLDSRRLQLRAFGDEVAG